MIHVTLTEAEVRAAVLTAAERQIENLWKRRQHAYGAEDGIGWQMHIEGCLGELAVAKWKNRYWNGSLGDLKAADVGRLQVRATTHDTGRLALHPKDSDGDAFILVTGQPPTLTLRGWCWGLNIFPGVNAGDFQGS